MIRITYSNPQIYSVYSNSCPWSSFGESTNYFTWEKGEPQQSFSQEKSSLVYNNYWEKVDQSTKSSHLFTAHKWN